MSDALNVIFRDGWTLFCSIVLIAEVFVGIAIVVEAWRKDRL